MLGLGQGCRMIPISAEDICDGMGSGQPMPATRERGREVRQSARSKKRTSRSSSSGKRRRNRRTVEQRGRIYTFAMGHPAHIHYMLHVGSTGSVMYVHKEEVRLIMPGMCRCAQMLSISQNARPGTISPSYGSWPVRHFLHVASPALSLYPNPTCPG